MVSKNCGSAATAAARASKVAATQKRLQLKRRKDCILKKTWEFSVLCDVDACAIVIGPDGKVETWPENHDAVMKPIKRYQEYLRKNNQKNVISLDDQFEKKKVLQLTDREWELDDAWIDTFFKDPVPLDDVLIGDQLLLQTMDNLLKDSVPLADNEDCEKKQELNFHSWEDCLLKDLPMEPIKDLMTVVDQKLVSVAKRIDFLNQQNNLNKSKEFVSMPNIQYPNNCFFFGNLSNTSSASSSSDSSTQNLLFNNAGAIIQAPNNCSFFGNLSNTLSASSSSDPSTQNLLFDNAGAIIQAPNNCSFYGNSDPINQKLLFNNAGAIIQAPNNGSFFGNLSNTLSASSSSDSSNQNLWFNNGGAIIQYPNNFPFFDNLSNTPPASSSWEPVVGDQSIQNLLFNNYANFYQPSEGLEHCFWPYDPSISWFSDFAASQGNIQWEDYGPLKF